MRSILWRKDQVPKALRLSCFGSNGSRTSFISVEVTYKARYDHVAAQDDVLANEYLLENPRTRSEVAQ